MDPKTPEHIDEIQDRKDPAFRKTVILLSIFSSILGVILVMAVIFMTKEGAISQTLPPEIPQESLRVPPSETQRITDRYTVTDTMQTSCFDNQKEIACEAAPAGQDAAYQNNLSQYEDNGDGTITDLKTGLMWQQDPSPKMQYQTAIDGAETFTFAGYDDWRAPTIKELYSLMDFRGIDPPAEGTTSTARPFIDTSVFGFQYGDETAGDRFIDSQWVTTAQYISTVMGKDQCFFGVNFADGRIKCYPTQRGKTYYVRYVRGPAYGVNDFVDNQDQTITDRATGLTWMERDSGKGMSWQEALAFCEDLTLAGSNDWRLPNAKELQSIVDYTRSPDVTNSPAIDPIFATSSITNEAGQNDYPYFWTSTTHESQIGLARNAVYIAFGRAMGYMMQFGGWVDVHGAGAQRSDPKMGSSSRYPQGHGPQGDAIRIQNYVRCVTGGDIARSQGSSLDTFPTQAILPPSPIAESR